MNNLEESAHHLLPAVVGSSIMLTVGEHIITSVITGVLIFVVTNGLSALYKKVYKK